MVSFSKKDTELRKFILVMLLIFSVILPLINNFGISLICSLINGDIMQQTLYGWLSSVGKVFDTLELFVSFALLIGGVIRYGVKRSESFIMIFLARTLIVYSSYFAIAALLYGNFSSQFAANVEFVLINLGIDLLLFFGVIFITCYLKSVFLRNGNTDITVKKFIDLSNPVMSATFWCCAVISLFLLSGKIANTFSDIVTYGASHLNMTEIIYLVSPYISWLIKCVCGYALMYFSARILCIKEKNSEI